MGKPRNYPKCATLHSADLTHFVVHVLVWIAAVGSWEIKGHDLYSVFKLLVGKGQPPKWHRVNPEHSITSVIYLPKISNLNLIMRKQTDWNGETLYQVRPVISKYVELIKVKERSEEWEPSHDRNETAHCSVWFGMHLFAINDNL